MKIGTLVVEIGADTSDLDRGIANTESKLSGLGGTVKTAVAGIAAVGAAAAAAAAVGLANLVSETIDAIEAQADLAKTLNTTVASMQTLERAGGLAGVSIQQISAAGRALTLNLAKAAEDGASPAAQALSKLGLSAEQLYNLPLDQRINAINAAIAENIPAVQQAAVAADLFGAKNAAAIQQLDPESIAEAKRQVELFGVALSAIDETKIGNARDAMDVFGMATEGVRNQLAVEFAPVLEQLSKDFMEAVEAGGGMGTIVKDAVQQAVDVVVFLANAADGVARAFDVAANAIVVAFQTVQTVITGALTTIVGAADEVLQAFGNESLKPVAEGMRVTFEEQMRLLETAAAGTGEKIAANLAAPLAGDRIQQYVDNANVAGNVSAAEDVAGRSAAQGGEAEAGARSPVPGLNLDEWLAEQETFAQLEMDVAQRQIDLANQVEQELNGVAAANAKERERIAQQEAAAKQRILGQAFGGLTTLMNSESRKMFEIGKTAAIAQSLVATYTGMTEALKLGWPLGPIAAGAIGLTGFANVQSIRSQSFGGGGGGGGASSATQAVNAASTPVAAPGGGGGAPGSTYSIAGLNRDDLFSGGQVRALIGRINEEQRNGSRVEFVD